jgi:hypothetical protein
MVGYSEDAPWQARADRQLGLISSGNASSPVATATPKWTN